MEITALTCKSCDDLMNYARYIDALGVAISEMAFHNTDGLVRRGEHLGMTISNCAEAINNVLNELYAPIDKIFDHGDASFLSELKKIRENVQEGFMGLHGNLSLLQVTIDKIDQFMLNDFKQISELRVEFEKMHKDISRQILSGLKQKEAPAKADDQAEAKSVDQS